VLALACAAPAAAQGPAYTAAAPTHQVLYRDGQTDRWLLGGTWLSRADPSDVGIAQGWFQDQPATDGWSTTGVPDSYNAGDLSTRSWYGSVGWYRKDFLLPSNAFAHYVPQSARHWIIRFESVIYYATVWLNGRQVGTHAGGYLPWEIDLSGLRPGVNRLIVRVDDRTNAATLPPGPGSNWWNFGGIQREVYLRAVARADLESVRIRPLLACVTGCPATIDEQVLVRNVTGATQTVRLRGSYGGQRVDFGRATLPPHATWAAHALVLVLHPRLWTPASPTLYKATLTLADARGRPLGGYLDYSGIRTITVAHGRLELNGRLLNLRGVDLQEQNLSTGSALTPGQTVQLVNWVRELGGHIIRTHHPVGPLMEELADRYGILIWSEVPVWGIQNQYLSQPGWLAQAHQALRENILENENHPSILLWSIGNELPTPPTPAEAAYIQGATALVRRLDPTRPVGLSIMGLPGQGCQAAYTPLDVIGANEYFGVFDQARGATDDRTALGPFLDSFRACYSRKALMVSEFGFDGDRKGPAEEYGTYQFQSNMIAYHLGVFAAKRWLSAAMYQILQDYAAYPWYTGGNNGNDPYATPPFNQKGLVDRYGHPKPAFAVASQRFHATQQVGP
jgi:beta-glucuronidase